MPICTCGCESGDDEKVTLRPRKNGGGWRKHAANYTIISPFDILPASGLYDRLHYVYMSPVGPPHFASADMWQGTGSWPLRPAGAANGIRRATRHQTESWRRLRVKRTMLFLMLTMLIALFGAAGCRQAAPGSDNFLATATAAAQSTNSAPIVPGTTVLPPIAASPTPGVPATIDPAAPLAGSPTPTIDPAAPPVVDPTAAPAVPEATVAPTPETSASGEIIHTVQPGENLFRIGLRYGFTYQELAAYNGITNPAVISVGQQIRIPPK